MAERLKAAVLKTADREVRGFESLSLRQFRIAPAASSSGVYILGTWLYGVQSASSKP